MDRFSCFPGGDLHMLRQRQPGRHFSEHAASRYDEPWKRLYRCWSIFEDAKLVEALINMINTGGFKADNSFKSGYLQYLEKKLKESIPNSDILGKPHIESRIKTMKKDWQVVYDMLHGANTSGFGYDSEKHCVTAEPSVWESYLQVHKEAAKWKNKTFPNFEDLCIVFGKDRAQRSRARDFVEMEADANMEERTQHSNENLNDSMEDNATTQTNVQSEEGSSGTRKRKHRCDPFIEALKESAIELGERLGERLIQASASLVEVEVDLHKKTAMLNSEIEKIQSLSRREMFVAIQKITSKPEAVLTFWNLKEESREDWVRFMLDQ